MQKIEKTTLVDQALTALKSKIEASNVGDKFPTEAQICEELGISRSTAREVLVILQAQGYIEIRRGLGTYIADKNKSDLDQFSTWFRSKKFEIQELLEMRMAIEPYVAELAAIRISEDELAELGNLFSEFEEVLRYGSVQEKVAADEDFHGLILHASRNNGLKMFYNTFIPSLREYRSRVFSPPADPLLALGHHEKIFNAIRNRQPEVARQVMRDHVLHSKVDVDRIAQTLGVDVSDQRLS